jgi:BlaI family transcriptional regulator, penicillinase repressor
VTRPDPTKLTRRERAIMDILHRRGRATAHDVLAELDDPPSYSAVRAQLRILEERGFAKHTVDGITYVYSPVAAPAEAKRSALAHVVKTFFAGSVEQAVAALVDRKLSREELDRLGELIDRAKKEGR